MKISVIGTKYGVFSSSKFNKELKKIYRQGKNIDKLIQVVKLLSDGKKLEAKYDDHALQDTKYYRNCRECHIEPDWLLVYQYVDDELILLLVATGSHSELF